MSMSHKNSYELSFLEILTTSVARMGKIPDHIAIIMDGNRRYARRKGLEVSNGHKAGADTLLNLYRWGNALGCKELTVYAFSSENYKRSKQEVDYLMELMEQRCTQLLQAIESHHESDTCIQMIGNLDNLPEKLRHRVAHLMQRTRLNKPYRLNVAVAYTSWSREGILAGLKALIDKDQDKNDPSELNEYIIHQSHSLMDLRPVDMLIRTGGDQRLSDFMLWEASQAYIYTFYAGFMAGIQFWRTDACDFYVSNAYA
ncbi:dehydrodolichyl diphosphate synthase complex subunit DHDDS isoform X1 [Folsomia candida]|uniref:dehydrodolichyl diphosphate synthase complex subunit DHDDS isoform X1 n=1 Tax=Folsomia candida TaxID=158441 RepID=UPI001604CC62|nr:dehydrodolichyl diphosphate synthase complex subunit DHDDS isoform X1 [Folsomia candida]XP_035714962.1 dehydrodolichyl diphosphate synthase complex subunit DHDDS isoform X1 [Folsomia candida]